MADDLYAAMQCVCIRSDSDQQSVWELFHTVWMYCPPSLSSSVFCHCSSVTQTRLPFVRSQTTHRQDTQTCSCDLDLDMPTWPGYSEDICGNGNDNDCNKVLVRSLSPMV